MRAPDQPDPESRSRPPVAPAVGLDEVEVRLVSRLVGRLHRRDPLRGAALEALAGRPVPEDRVEAIVEAARGRHVRRAVAVWLLGLAPLGAQQRSQAVNAARRAHVGDVRRTGRQIMWLSLAAGGLTYAVIAGTMVLAFLTDAGVPGAIGAGMFGTGLLLAVTLGVGLMPAIACAAGVYTLLASGNAAILSTLRRGVRSLSMRTLARLRDLDSLPEIAMTVCDPGRRSLQQAATESLVRLLPTLRAEDAVALPMRAVPEMGRVLVAVSQDRRRPDLSLALLDALLRVGDGRAFHAVERVASRPPDDAVRQRAAEVLPAIEERYRAALSAQVLLRPACGQEDGAASLLRPAGVSASLADTGALLRPAEGQPAAATQVAETPAVLNAETDR